MKFSKLSLLSLAAISTPALACVQFSLNFNLDTQLINAALTDNGGQKCQITNQFFGIINNGYNTWLLERFTINMAALMELFARRRR
ncbi:hypothetical protein VE00_01075 [Pseudogymnoascus sp. WSF 3629]|nr:hypothetical protein VE00_01075 [Pseudogymnoascus sp. WSF 3629]